MMIFLLKRTKDSSDKEISFDKLAKLFNLATLKKNIDSLKIKVEELLSKPNVDKKFILDEVGKEFLKSGEIINLSTAESIEKMKGLPEGLIRYSKTQDKFRVKTKEGWKSIVLE